MDPRDRADALLAKASSQRRGVVTPDNATSPMDASSTSRIPRSVIRAVDDEQDTMSIPAPQIDAAAAKVTPTPEPEAAESLDGLVPTVAKREPQRSLSDRLAGLD